MSQKKTEKERRNKNTPVDINNAMNITKKNFGPKGSINIHHKK